MTLPRIIAKQQYDPVYLVETRVENGRRYGRVYAETSQKTTATVFRTPSPAGCASVEPQLAQYDASAGLSRPQLHRWPWQKSKKALAARVIV